MRDVFYRDLEDIDYKQAWDLQESLLAEMIERKLQNRKAGDAEKRIIKHHLLFCEHPHVYTLGRSGKEAHLLLGEQQRQQKAIQYFKINRGGDITYHGPGQLVGYPLLDLDEFFTDVHKYVRYLEEAVIRTLSYYDLKGMRIDDFTGVWLDGKPQRKICAIGVHLRRWITMHGFAFNLNTDLDYFGHIIPCGIADENKSVTSLANELGHEVDIQEVKERMLFHLQEVFKWQLIR